MSLRIRLVDAVTGAASWLKGSNGAAMVVANFDPDSGQAPVTGVVGTEITRFMMAVESGSAPTGVEIFNDATGVKYLRVTADGFTATEAIYFAYGTVSGDTSVEANAQAALTEGDGTHLGGAFYNIFVLDALHPTAEIIWDGANKIKRLVGITTEAAARDYNLITVG